MKEKKQGYEPIIARDDAAAMKWKGVFEQAVRFIEATQICDVNLWTKFVEQYRTKPDGHDLCWRCEYWGKMMRGSAMVVRYTNNLRLYEILEAAVRDMLTTQEENGRFSTYEQYQEFQNWDMWGRKYVLLGMQYFLEICRDKDLEAEIITAMKGHADYIIDKIGPNEGQLGICQSSKAWGGLNSSSILEPMVRLYELTGEQKYLDYSAYIISEGFNVDGNLIELALADEVAPHQYPVVKAYEMMSCFEGLIRYYYVTGEEKYKTACLNFGKKILETEISIIGTSGCTHELFDNTAMMQTKTGYNGVMQETCVTVTWMKLATALLQLSGNVAYADAVEQSFFNAYMGAFNTRMNLSSNSIKDVPQFLPFDSYSPLTPDRRGKFVGGYNRFPDRTFYGCCACIGGAGAGIIPQMAWMKQEGGFVWNFYMPGEIKTVTPQGKNMTVKVDTKYPVDGYIRMTTLPDAGEKFSITLRVPAWCRNATIRINGVTQPCQGGYNEILRRWKPGDVLELYLPMLVERILPPAGAQNEDQFAGYRRGPIVLAVDARLANPDVPHPIRCDATGVAEGVLVACPEIPDCMECVELNEDNGTKIRMVDYSSAGKTWDEESKCAAWIYRE
ncbi:MAG: glycoside hydrolase family 127 protein [Clostridia bacterium]|nr:glycoside hydrolase family 127 protein [Clostridia bacterium]